MPQATPEPAVTQREVEIAMAVGPCRCRPGAGCLLDTDVEVGCAYCFYARPAYPCPAEVDG